MVEASSRPNLLASSSRKLKYGGDGVLRASRWARLLGYISPKSTTLEKLSH